MNKVLKLLVLSSLFSTTLAYTASSDDIKELTKARSSSKLQRKNSTTNSNKDEIDVLNNPATNGAGAKQFNLNEKDDETSKNAQGEEEIIVD